MFVYTFQAMWRHRPLEEYLVFVGIRDNITDLSIHVSRSHPTTSTIALSNVVS